ncbi:hypothetical protein [Streptomyces sp. NPDC051909]|uniref:hypothetical protein n=1 Tax=Streptomyces sp. NPDC051909 TaxID=3154944 RepID=UPI0034302C7B
MVDVSLEGDSWTRSGLVVLHTELSSALTETAELIEVERALAAVTGGNTGAVQGLLEILGSRMGVPAASLGNTGETLQRLHK